MGTNQICERFALLTGIDEDELSRWMPLIYDAQEYVTSLLKENVDVQHHKVLTSAVGTYAYYKWCILCSGGNESTFKAGDLSISDSSSSGSVENAELLWKESLKEIAPYVKSEDFFFKGVVV